MYLLMLRRMYLLIPIASLQQLIAHGNSSLFQNMFVMMKLVVKILLFQLEDSLRKKALIGYWKFGQK